MEGFVYVVNPPEIPKVAFGSGLERETLPLTGPSLSPFMRQIQGDVFSSPGPTARVDERNHMLIKYASKLGYSAFVSKLPRLPPPQIFNYPCVGSYEVSAGKQLTETFVPFNVGALRKEISKYLTPAPNTYTCSLKRPQMRVNTAFCTQRKFIPVVQIKCSPFNTSQCSKCRKTPKGDYWHNFDDDSDLCRPCRHKIVHKIKSCQANESERIRLRQSLLPYRIMRYCGFFHDHKGTTAATQLISKKTLKFKIKKENYLSMYM